MRALNEAAAAVASQKQTSNHTQNTGLQNGHAHSDNASDSDSHAHSNEQRTHDRDPSPVQSGGPLNGSSIDTADTDSVLKDGGAHDQHDSHALEFAGEQYDPAAEDGFGTRKKPNQSKVSC